MNPRFVLPECPLVRARGRVVGCDVESHRDPAEVDHFWIFMDLEKTITISVNTMSKRNRAAGFDSRVRVGRVHGGWTVLPKAGAVCWPRNDYADIEARENVFYEHHERSEMEDLLGGLCRTSCFIEVFGAPYRRTGEGIHQVHSRRTSCAVAEDIVGLDGALTFYREEDHRMETLLLKFCGQP